MSEVHTGICGKCGRALDDHRWQNDGGGWLEKAVCQSQLPPKKEVTA